MKNQFIARKIMKRLSEKPTEAEPRALQSLAIETIAQNFELYPHLEGVTNPFIIDSIYSSIDLNSISVITLAQSIDNESFWKRACKETFAFSENNMLLQKRGIESQLTFKQKFFELYFQRLLKNKDLSLEFFMKISQVAGKFLKSFSIEEVPSTIGNRIFDVLALMPNLEILRCTFLSSSKDYSYEGEFVRGIDEVRAGLIEVNARFQNLHTMILENNDLTGPTLKIILRSLVGCKKLKELRLGHNKLSDEGIRVLCKFMNRYPDIQLQRLDLCDNEIGFNGALLISEWIRKESCSLVELSLKTNYLNNLSFSKMIEKLLENRSSKLKTLDLTANLLRDDCGEMLTDFVAKNKTLEFMILDANEIHIGQHCAQTLHTAFEARMALKELSLRYNQVEDDILIGLRYSN